MLKNKFHTSNISFCKIDNKGIVLERTIRYARHFYVSVQNRALYSNSEVRELQSLNSFIDENSLDVVLLDEFGNRPALITFEEIEKIKFLASTKKKNKDFFNKVFLVSRDIVFQVLSDLGINSEDGIVLKATSLNKIVDDFANLISLKIIQNKKFLISKKSEEFSNELLAILRKHKVLNIERLNDYSCLIEKAGSNIVASQDMQKKSFAISKY